MKVRKYIKGTTEVNMFRTFKKGKTKADTFMLISGDMLKLNNKQLNNITKTLVFTTNDGKTVSEEYTFERPNETITFEYYDPNNPPTDPIDWSNADD